MDKMKTAIAKLKKTTINAYLTYLIFNAYMIKSIYFGYGIIELNKKIRRIASKGIQRDYIN